MPEFRDVWLPEPDESGRVAPVRPAVRLEVYRMNGTSGNGQSDPTDLRPVYLPSVVCTAIEEREGPFPPTAVFRYAFDGRDPQSPQSVEAALSTAVTAGSLPHLVEVGDRLAVLAYLPDGDTEWVFDGFPLAWSFRLDGGAEAVHMDAVSVAKRLWDTPVGGAIVRNSDTPEEAFDFVTEAVAQLNPRGVPNASPGSAPSGREPSAHPVLMDPTVTGTDSGGAGYPRSWSLAAAARYLLFTAPEQGWVKFPKGTALDALLIARSPRDGVPYDPTDPDSYTAAPIQCPDTPLTGRALPAVLYDLIKNAGFGMRFHVSTGPDGMPQTTLDLFLRQAPAPKPLLLQNQGSTFDPALSNLAGCALARDLSGVVNRYEVVGHQRQYEASFVLAPGFSALQHDEDAAAGYDLTSPTFVSDEKTDKYRLFVFDEDGSGHYPNLLTGAGPTDVVSADATPLDDVLGAPVDGAPVYGTRRRPPSGTLLSTGDDGVTRLKASLSISTDYNAASKGYPTVWGVGGSGWGTWRPVHGGWELLKDRIGIRLTVKNPQGWDIGKSATGTPFTDGHVKTISCLSNPTTANPAFYLRLTCVIEGDFACSAFAGRQASSPIGPAVTRQVDARDRLFQQAVAKNSQYNDTADPVVVRDDFGLALAEARSYRTASEAGVMGGTATLARFTRAYQIGDRVSEIRGRGLGLRTDTGGSGFAAVLPVVVGVRHDLEGRQTTTLELSDAGLDRRRYGLKKPAAPKRPRSSAEGHLIQIDVAKDRAYQT